MSTIQNPGTITLEDGRFKIKINPQALWSNIKDVLVSYANGEYASVAKDGLAVVSSISQTNTIEHKAFQLIFRALQESCISILTKHPDQERLLEKVAKAGMLVTGFRLDMSQKIGNGNYSIDASFWASPHHSPFVKDAQADYSDFLCKALGLEEAHANALSAVLPSAFVRELALEWEASDYSALIEHFKNPFLGPLKTLAVHEARHADLLQRFAKPAFSDPSVTLAEMYIEPDFWLHGSCLSEKEKRDEGDFIKVESKQGQHPFFRHKTITALHPFVLRWIKKEPCFGFKNEKESVLIILGQPGQGKSSSFLRTIDQVLREHPGTVENVFLVRLRDIYAASKLIEDPIPVLTKHLRLDSENGLKDSLLLLDGLDELYMSQGLTLAQIHDFVRKLRLQLKNHPDLSLRIALTSRTNYLKLDDLSAEDYLVIHLSDLSLDQQKEWLKRHKKHYSLDCALNEEDLEKIAAENNPAFRKIRELVNQPILLQMIAASGMKMDEKANSALIYNQLFEKLIQRDWSPEDGQLDKFKKLTKKDLLKFLRTLALHISQKPSGHEYARRQDFEQEGPLKQEIERLAKKLGVDQLPIKDLVKDLLVSFYFQEVQREGEEKSRSDDHDSYAYEFLHKSLQEYLVAEHVWETFRTEFLDEREEEYRIKTAKEAYSIIAPLFEPKVLTQEIADYLFEIIENDQTTDKVKLKQRLKEFLPGLLKGNFLWEHKLEEGQPSATDKICGNFYGYWTVASAMITPSKINVKDGEAFSTEIKVQNLIPMQYLGTFVQLYALLAGAHFRLVKLATQNLIGANLIGADLNRADLSGANLNRANLNRANLIGANLNRANLIGAYLSGADLSGADLSRANLSESDLFGAYLNRADLSEAYLRKADLSIAELVGADLHGADLIGADLHGVNLFGANLIEANLRGANLRGANLFGADLSRAVLWEDGLSGANLEGANLENVRGLELAIGLEHANFKGTIYEGKFSKKSEPEA